MNAELLLLPYCDYPCAGDIDEHGLQPLPAILPLMTMDEAQYYRSENYKAVIIDSFNHRQVLQLARVLAKSFAVNEPMIRHLQLPLSPPPKISTAMHDDPFGEDRFCYWRKENIMYWVIRLFVLTDPASPLKNIELNGDLITHSVAIRNDAGEIIGGALNMPVNFEAIDAPIRANDLFIDTVYSFFQPIHHFIKSQEITALNYLSDQYPDFKRALINGEVGTIFMVARSPLLPTEDAFELMAASIERFKEFGYAFVVTAAANQWTGAALELMGAVRVHYAPYRAIKRVKKFKRGLQDDVSSEDGYLSGKDSGCMFYITRLK